MKLQDKPFPGTCWRPQPPTGSWADWGPSHHQPALLPAYQASSCPGTRQALGSALRQVALLLHPHCKALPGTHPVPAPQECAERNQGFAGFSLRSGHGRICLPGFVCLLGSVQAEERKTKRGQILSRLFSLLKGRLHKSSVSDERLNSETRHKSLLLEKPWKR